MNVIIIITIGSLEESNNIPISRGDYEQDKGE